MTRFPRFAGTLLLAGLAVLQGCDDDNEAPLAPNEPRAQDARVFTVDQAALSATLTSSDQTVIKGNSRPAGGGRQRHRPLGRRHRQCLLPGRGAAQLERQARAVCARLPRRRRSADGRRAGHPQVPGRQRLCLGGVELQHQLLRRARRRRGHQRAGAGVQLDRREERPHAGRADAYLHHRRLDGRARHRRGDRRGEHPHRQQQGPLRRRGADVRRARRCRAVRLLRRVSSRGAAARRRAGDDLAGTELHHRRRPGGAQRDLGGVPVGLDDRRRHSRRREAQADREELHRRRAAELRHRLRAAVRATRRPSGAPSGATARSTASSARTASTPPASSTSSTTTPRCRPRSRPSTPPPTASRATPRRTACVPTACAGSRRRTPTSTCRW